MIKNLPYYESKDLFEDSYQKIMESELIDDYHKKYIEDKCTNKKIWAKCYLKVSGFMAGVTTTSRVESHNALIKKHINSNSLLTEFMDFYDNEVFKPLEYVEKCKGRKKSANISLLSKVQFISDLELLYSPYIVHKIKENFFKGLNYKIIAEERNKW